MTKEFKGLPTSTLLDVDTEVLTDVEAAAHIEELGKRLPFEYYDERMEGFERQVKDLNGKVEDLGTLVGVKHQLDEIKSLLLESMKPKKGRPPKRQ